MRLLQVRLIVLATALSATGCSDPKAPTEANFRKVIEAQLASHPVCTLEQARIGTVLTLPPDLLTQDYLDLQSAGAVSIKEIPAPPRAAGTWHEMTVVKSDIWQEGKGLCYGERVLDKIVRWTEPTSLQGMTVSEVTIHWKLRPAKWVTERFLESHHEKMENDDRVTLVLNNDGWRIPEKGMF